MLQVALPSRGRRTLGAMAIALSVIVSGSLAWAQVPATDTSLSKSSVGDSIKPILSTDLPEADRAILASVKTDLRNLMTAEEAHFSDKQTYTTVAELKSSGDAYLSAGNTIGAYDAGSPNDFLISVRNNSPSSGPIECRVQRASDASHAGPNDSIIECYLAKR